MSVAVQIVPPAGAPPEVDYRWDEDTDILTASIRAQRVGEGMSGSVEIAGADGSWLVLDVTDGHINGVEVAVWPDVRNVGSLAPPARIEDARVILPSRVSQPEIAALEVNAPLRAESDAEEHIFHFVLGKPKQTRVLRLARDLLIEVDPKSRIAGLWMLNVPPYPTGQ